MSTEFKPQKATLDGTPIVEPNATYLVDFNKLESVNDLVTILAAMGISFPANHPNFEHVKRFLLLDSPLHINKERPVESKQINLPKLKTL